MPAKLRQRYGIAGRGRYMSWGLYQDRFDLSQGAERAEPLRMGGRDRPVRPVVDPVKHTALGRYAHEGATVILAKDGRPLPTWATTHGSSTSTSSWQLNRYDPANRQAKMPSSTRGTLYVARFRDDGTGEWLPLIQGQGPLTEANGFPSAGRGGHQRARRG